MSTERESTLMGAYVTGAYLREQLVDSVLANTESLASEWAALASGLARVRNRARNALAPHLRNAHDLPLPPSSIAVGAVDGALAIKRALAADLVVATAVGADGIEGGGRANSWVAEPQAAWYALIPHIGSENSRVFIRGVMALLELDLLTYARHDVRILDGSHVTPVIHVNAMLSVDGPQIHTLVADVLSERRAKDSLANAAENPYIIALVKYDSSREVAETWLSELALLQDDRTILSVLLDGGEYTQPVPMGQTHAGSRNLKGLDIVRRGDFPEAGTLLDDMNAAIDPIRQLDLHFTYYKPWPWAPAYRIELKRASAEDPQALSKMLAAVRQEVYSPALREPYAQYVADRLAKTVGRASDGLQVAALTSVGRSSNGVLDLLMQPYRTEV